jgi:hypothetical protein
MADNTRDMDDDDLRAPEDVETREGERVRSSTDRDQDLEREDIESEHNRGTDEAVRGRGHSGDIDPDSAESDVDRDDFLTD